MSSKGTSGRALRLECLRIAANIVIQLKDPKLSVVELAERFHGFVNRDEAAEFGEADLDSDAAPSPSDGSLGNPSRYTLRDLRRAQR